MIEDKDTGRVAYRVSGDGTRDARKEAEQLTDVALVARRVICDGKRMRCAPEADATPSSLYLRSKGVTGYKLDESIAKAINVPPQGPAK